MLRYRQLTGAESTLCSCCPTDTKVTW